jgi:hypothetical protein
MAPALDSSPVIADRNRADENPPRVSLPETQILQDFERLIREKKLLGAARDASIVDGAEFDPEVVRKKGKGTRFLVRKVPSRKKLLRLWARHFENAILPCALLERLSLKTLPFEHRETILLFGRDWIMYDASIVQGDEGVGELTLGFDTVVDRKAGALAFLTGRRLRVVRIEHIHLTAQRSGYASALFRHYERLFGDLGFDQFQLSASLSVGKYYWAKEGFDFSDESEIGRRKERLRALVRGRGLPVSEAEIDGLRHAYEIAGFRRDVRIAAYRDKEGYYSLNADDRFREEAFLPLGKAFLLSSEPWEGYKDIRAITPHRAGVDRPSGVEVGREGK